MKPRKKKSTENELCKIAKTEVNQVLVVLDRTQRSISSGEAGQRMEARTEGR
jgi:hypothetical protein